MTFSIPVLSASRRHAESRDHFNVMLSDVRLNVFMLSVVMKNDIVLSVVAPV